MLVSGCRQSFIVCKILSLRKSEGNMETTILKLVSPKILKIKR